MQGELGKGSFQELDQVKAVQQFTKYAGQAKSVKDILPVITAAAKAKPSLLHPCLAYVIQWQTAPHVCQSALQNHVSRHFFLLSVARIGFVVWHIVMGLK